MPANYEDGFDSCKSDDVEPMGEVSHICSFLDRSFLQVRHILTSNQQM